MRVPASVLQQALKFSCEPGEDSGADAQASWLKSVFGVDAVAEQFVGKSRWTGEAREGPLFWRRMCGSLLPACLPACLSLSPLLPLILAACSPAPYARRPAPPPGPSQCWARQQFCPPYWSLAGRRPAHRLQAGLWV